MPLYILNILRASLIAEFILYCEYTEFFLSSFRCLKHHMLKAAAAGGVSPHPSRHPSMHLKPATASAMVRDSMTDFQAELQMLKTQVSALTASTAVSSASAPSLPVCALTYEPPTISSIARRPSAFSPGDCSSAARTILDMLPITMAGVDSTDSGRPEGMSFSSDSLTAHLCPTHSAGDAVAHGFHSGNSVFSLGCSIEPLLQEWICHGLLVPFEIISISDQGGSIDQYLKNCTVAPASYAHSRGHFSHVS